MAVDPGDFRSDMRANLRFLRREMKTYSAGNVVMIEQGHGGHLQLGRLRGQLFGQGSGFQKAEGGAGVKFNIHFIQPGGLRGRRRLRACPT